MFWPPNFVQSPINWSLRHSRPPKLKHLDRGLFTRNISHDNHVLKDSFLSRMRSINTLSVSPLTLVQVAGAALRPCRNPLLSSRFATLQKSFLSTETRQAIDKAVASAPVVLFMKGTPETPQCGFSRASIQILGLQGVDPQKFTAFNVLEDQELRQGV